MQDFQIENKLVKLQRSKFLAKLHRFFDPIAHKNLNFAVVGFKVISLHFWSNHRIIKRVLKHIDQNVKNSRLIP